MEKTSDIFSMGLTLYKALTGESVYGNIEELDSTSAQEVMMYVGSLLHSHSEIALSFPASIPHSIRAVIVKACSVLPEGRYQDAGEMREALAAAVEEIGEIDRREKGASKERRGQSLGALVLGLVLGLGLAGGSAWWMNRDPAVSPSIPDRVVERESPATSPPVAPESAPSDDAKRIQSLLVRADQQLLRDRVTRPVGDNAVGSYRAILTLDPSNPAGSRGSRRSFRARWTSLRALRREETTIRRWRCTAALNSQPPEAASHRQAPGCGAPKRGPGQRVARDGVSRGRELSLGRRRFDARLDRSLHDRPD